MSKSKDELIEQMREEMPYNFPLHLEPYVNELLDIYAQQKSIAFAEWCYRAKWTYHFANDYWFNDDTSIEQKTSEQLYKLFKQQP